MTKELHIGINIVWYSYFENSSGVIVQLVEPAHVKTEMTSNFTGQLSAMVPSPSTFVESSIKRLSYTDHTCGYWAHSLETWMVSSFFPNWVVSAGMLKEGTKQYEHAMRMLKDNRTNGWARDAIRLVIPFAEFSH